ncbi:MULTISPECIES: bile acid:sodium symporter family protein [unclassified Vibrio]|uniref:bile acid:sodium symporter family protein n=1 Tax=unclassified Vibrio TaxID=2614977 RepID=UPI001F31CFA0|nr:MULTISPECIES: bile acid:sodium symporter family protein [unclassified Vibrio]QXL80212.1 bile acid:sodium symporter family protein [Vibrio sp.]
MLRIIINAFPLWVVLGSVVAYLQPAIFAPLKPQIVPLLMLIMLSMGLTLTLDDFKRVTSSVKAVTVGLILQFSVMPLSALFVAHAFDMDMALTIGMVLVGSVAGGTASNVICYLAKGNVALSITMTAFSTLIGVMMTPFLVDALLGVNVDVPVGPMVLNLVKIVIIPITLGITLNHFFRRPVMTIAPVLPLVSMLSIVMAIAIIVALNHDKIAIVGLGVALAVILHNAMGLVLGYWVCRALKFDYVTCKTIAIEVGLQNSGLATALALKFFSPISALPAALFSIWHNLSGSILAHYWSRDKRKRSRDLSVS